VGYGEAADEAVRVVDAEMVLVAEHRHGDPADGPTLRVASCSVRPTKRMKLS
jgi:hypothetical protein